MKTSNIVLIALGVFVLLFIVSMTVIFCVMGQVPDTLIQYTLGAGGVEALALAGIKVSKCIKGNAAAVVAENPIVEAATNAIGFSFENEEPDDDDEETEEEQ